MRVCRGRGGVHQHQVIPREVVDEARRRVDDEGRAGHDENGRPRNSGNGGLDDALVEGLSVHNDVRAHLRGTRGARGHGILIDPSGVPERGDGPAARAHEPLPVAVQLPHGARPGPLVQAVDVLRDDSVQATRGLQGGQGLVRTVGLYGAVDLVEPLPVGLRMPLKEVDAQHRLQWNFALLKVKAVRPAKIGDARLGGHARASEKHGGR